MPDVPPGLAPFDDVADGIGLSIGATSLRAVAVGRSSVTRSPVVTLYPHRPTEVGVPSENPNLAERGLIITDFVDRVGDPVAIIAGDGSSHRAETLLADALRALLHALTGGRPATEPVGVTHPAHWRPAAVEALRGALAAQPELRDARLTSDALAALTALQDRPGLPSRGIIALCDVGGSGTSITLADAADGLRPIAPTVRHPDLSGDLVDQALLTSVVADLGASGTVDLSSTSAIGSLTRLRGQCRAAKERLSTAAVTSLPVELPGRRTEVRLTRVELDDAIRTPLAGFVDALQETLQRSGIRPADLVAAATVGGGSRLPIITTTLSEKLRVPVVTSAQPDLAAAIGAGLTAVRGLVPDGATSLAPAAVAPVVAAAPIDPGAAGSSTFRALAWSDADELPDPVPSSEPYQPTYEPVDPRPQLAFADRDEDDAAPAPLPWYRTPIAMAAIGLLAVAAVITAGSVYLLRDDEAPATTPSTGATTAGSEAPAPETPAPQSEAPQSQAPQSQAPNPQTVTEQAPPPVVTVTETPPPPATTEAPPSSTEPPPPPPSTQPPSTQAPTTQTTQPPSSTQPPIIPTLPYQTIPGLPFVPAPIQPAQP